MKGNKVLWVWLLAAAIIGIFLVDAATEQTQGAPSNVTVQTTIAISLSANMSNGLFNLTLNAGDNNISDPGMGGEKPNPARGNNVTVSSNTNVKLCISENAALTNKDDGVTTIPNANYTWFAEGNSSNLSVADSIAISTTYATANASVPTGGVVYFGFWIDIPPAQTAGEYNNTINIKGIRFALTC